MQVDLSSSLREGLNDDLSLTLTVHQVSETRSKIDCPINEPDAILQIMFSGRHISVNWTIMGWSSLCYLMNGINLMKGRRLGPKEPNHSSSGCRTLMGLWTNTLISDFLIFFEGRLPKKEIQSYYPRLQEIKMKSGFVTSSKRAKIRSIN